MIQIGGFHEAVPTNGLNKVRELVRQLATTELNDDSTLEAILNSACDILLSVKNLSENGYLFLRLVTLIFDLSKEVSDSYARTCVKRFILPALYYWESSAIYEIQSLHHLENQYVPPCIPLHNENNSFFPIQQENKSSHNSDGDSDDESNQLAKCETSLPPMTQPYQQLESLYRTLRGIRQHLIYFEVNTILSNADNDIFLSGKIPRLVTFIVLESAHCQGILPNLPSLVESSDLYISIHQALEIVGEKLEGSIEGSSWNGKEKKGRLRGPKELNRVHEIELDRIKLGSIDLNIMQLHNGYESVSVTIPLASFNIGVEDQNSMEFLQKWDLPPSLIKIWTKQTSSSIEGLDDYSTTLSIALKKINEHEESGRLRRWADVSRVKVRFFVLPFLSKRRNSHSLLVADLSELKRAYFVNGLAGGIWAAFWSIILLFTFVIVFLQIVSAESFLSLITVWNSKEKYAITAILYESANSNNVMITVYCISMLPLIWGFYKGLKSMLSITNDPKEEFREILSFLKSQTVQETSGWFLRVVWWDRLRWQLPWYVLRNQLEGLMELMRWDARISAADRFDSLSILILLYQSRGGETKSVVSGFIAEIADIMRFNVSNVDQNTHGDKDSSLLDGKLQTSDEEKLIIRAAKIKAINFLLSMGEFPATEWTHSKWYTRPYLLWNYLEGRYLNWWIGLSSALFEFVLFVTLTIILIAISLLFVSTAVEAIREYAACPQMKGIAFTGPAPYVGKFDADCWRATMKEFGRIPGQPVETLISAFPKFYFSKETKKSFILDISGKYLDGYQVGKLIDGFRENGFIITRLIANQNSIATLTQVRPGYLIIFSNALEMLSSSLQVLDLSECGLGEGSSSFEKDASEWRRFYDVLGNLGSLRTLNIAGNLLGINLRYSSESGEKLSTLFLNSVGKLTGLEDLDLSDNALSFCDDLMRPDICLDIGKAIVSIRSLKYLKLRKNYYYDSADGYRGMIDTINNPDLIFLDLSENPADSMELRHVILSLLSRHQKLEHLDLAGTFLFSIVDDNHEDFTHRFNACIGSLAGSLKYFNLSQAALVGSTIVGSTKHENFFINALQTIGTFEKLETLDLSCNTIGSYSGSDQVSSAMAGMLSNLRSLRELSVQENYLGFKLWSVVSEHLKLHPQLESIPYLISTEDIEEFVSSSLLEGRLVLTNRLITGFAKDEQTENETADIYHRIFNIFAKQSNAIISLDVSGVGLNLYSPYDLQLLGEGLETIALNGQKLQELSLADNYIAICADATALTSLKKGILAHRDSLKHLNLSGKNMRLSVEFAQMLKDIFLELTKLESLNLYRNDFGVDKTVYQCIGEGIMHLRSLRKLVLGRNFRSSISAEGAMFLFNSISKLDYLQELYVGELALGNHPSILPSFSDIFSMPSLRSLHLKRNVLFNYASSSGEPLNFFESMKKAKNLRTLDLTDNKLGQEPLWESKVINTIKTFENLCSLYVSGNMFGFGSGSKGIGDLMHSLPRLIGYDLRGVAGVDWTEHATSISGAIARDLRSKCESRVCRGTEVATEPPSCPV